VTRAAALLVPDEAYHLKPVDVAVVHTKKPTACGMQLGAAPVGPPHQLFVLAASCMRQCFGLLRRGRLLHRPQNEAPQIASVVARFTTRILLVTYIPLTCNQTGIGVALLAIVPIRTVVVAAA